MSTNEATAKEKPDSDKGGPGSGHGGGQDKKVDLLIIVTGDEVEVKAKLDDELSEVVETALKKTEHKGRPVTDWDLRTESGEVLDLNRTVRSYSLQDGAILSLTLKAGVAG